MKIDNDSLPTLNRKQKNVLQQVTPFSKYAAMLLFIVMPFIGGWIGYGHGLKEIGSVPEQVSIPATNDTKLSASGDVVIAYEQSNYRVVSVTENPFYSDESNYDRLVIAAARGVNDYACGGLYGPGTCFLFLESSYADIETPKFVGEWSQGQIATESIEFISPTEITFTVSFADAGFGYEALWQLDLEVGSSTKLSFEEYYSEPEV